MTMSNNDMVALFPDVINCMQIDNWEIKKMCAESPQYERDRTDTTRCFLYLTNYARSKPEAALKALPVLLHVSIISGHVSPPVY